MNSMMIFILLSTILLRRELSLKKVTGDRFGRFFLAFCFLPLIVLPLSDTLSFLDQFKQWIQIMSTDYLPVIIAIVVIKRIQDVDYFFKTFIICGVICMCYGFLSFIMNNNPYLNLITNAFPHEIELLEYGTIELEDFMRFTSSTFAHINAYGYFLTYLFCLVVLFQNKFNRKHLFILIGMILLSIIMSSKRSPIIVVGLVILYFVYKKKSLIIPFLAFAVIGFFLLFTLPQFQYLRNIFIAAIYFWDDAVAESVNVSGSSMNLRINQTIYPFVEIKNNLLFGHGFGWCTTFIKETQRIHPVLYGFESITSTVVCELGLLGIVLYYKLFKSSYNNIKRLSKGLKINLSMVYIFAILLMYFATGLQYIFFFLITIVALEKSAKYNNYLNMPLFNTIKKQNHRLEKNEYIVNLGYKS